MVPKVLFTLLILCPVVSSFAQLHTGTSASVFTESAFLPEFMADAGKATNNQPQNVTNVAVKKLVPPSLAKQIVKWQSSETKRGELKGWYSNGQLALVASFHKAEFLGVWVSYHDNGTKRDEGQFERGYPTGEWKSWYRSGVLRSVRHFSASKLMSVEIWQSTRNPKLSFSKLATAALVNPRLFTKAISAGNAFSGLGSPDETYEPPFVKCLLHGFYADYFANGMMKENGYYQDGLKDGLCTKWSYKGEVLSTAYYFNGLLHGGCESFSLDGRINRLSEYHKGKLMFSKDYSY